ncbi:MAG: hypothetical protein PUP92_38430 [Rhizonema sp. PD38]|nr:hypothetical protein [Rhizonema sp. PD38]
MLNEDTVVRKNLVARKHLVTSLVTGLIIGIIAGSPIGRFTHQFFHQQRLAQVLLCRENHRNQPAAVVDSQCGTPY